MNEKRKAITYRLYDYFDENFAFDDDQPLIIKQISLHLDINENIIKDLIIHVLRQSFKELLLDTTVKVTIKFPIFNLTNF